MKTRRPTAPPASARPARPAADAPEERGPYHPRAAAYEGGAGPERATLERRPRAGLGGVAVTVTRL